MYVLRQRSILTRSDLEDKLTNRSQIHFWQHGRIGASIVTKPIILGHESAGQVEFVGPGVTGLKVGDRVALEPGIACNVCAVCRAGKYNLCEEMRFAATPPYDGTLSGYYVLPEECCFRLPPEISYGEGALVEPLSVAVHCCKLAGVVPGASVAVFGAGPIGLLCCAIAQAFGASKMVIADIVESRLDFAREYLPVSTYRIGGEIGEQDGEKFNRDLMLSKLGASGTGADVVIDATGAEICIGYGIDTMKRGGVFVQAGLGAPIINFPIGKICDKEGIFKGSFRYGPGDYALAIELLTTGRVNVSKLITHRYDFSNAAEAFLNASGRVGIKSIINGPEFHNVTVNGV